MGGQSDYGSCTQCIRFTFIGCNIFFCVLSLLGFIIGIWSVVAANNDDSLAGENAVSSGAILLTSSIISFGLCAIGIVGGIFMWRPFLIVYAIVLCLIIILEFISAILAFVYADNAREEVRDTLEDYIRDYRVSDTDEDYDESINDAVDNAQENLKCCGIDNATDWGRLNPEAVAENGGAPPDSCECDPDDDDNCVLFLGAASTTYVWEDGCLDTLETFVRVYSIAVGIVSLIIMLIEIVFVVVAIGLTVTIIQARAKGGFV